MINSQTTITGIALKTSMSGQLALPGDPIDAYAKRWMNLLSLRYKLPAAGHLAIQTQSLHLPVKITNPLKREIEKPI